MNLEKLKFCSYGLNCMIEVLSGFSILHEWEYSGLRA